MIGRSSFHGPLGILQEKCLYVLFSGTVMLVLASLAVPKLTLVCVCACSCVGVSISYVELLKFEGGAMVDMVPFISGNVWFLLCNEALRTSSSLAVKGEAVQISLADVSHSCQQNLPCTKHFSRLTVYRGKAYSTCDK